MLIRPKIFQKKKRKPYRVYTNKVHCRELYKDVYVNSNQQSGADFVPDLFGSNKTEKETDS